MAQFITFDSSVNVNGETILSVVDGMGQTKNRAIEILKKNGIDNPEPGKWYSQQAWLDSFKEISEELGAFTLFSIGKKIPENAQFPPEIDDIEKALAAIDVAFHMNHSINGKPLFDPNNGQMDEGIGHYGFEKSGDKEASMECNNPYPCDFDRGIIESMAQRFKPEDSSIVMVKHDDSKPCRKKGDDSCTYNVKW